jgi:hypothetical protein
MHSQLSPRGGLRAAPLLVLPLALSAGCKNENNVKSIAIDALAVTAGDFDRLEETLIRADIQHTVFEGYIRSPLYEADDVDPTLMNPKAEELFTGTDEDGYPVMSEFDAILVNSGTRGLGAYVYNDVDTDDAFLGDPRVTANLADFMKGNRTLVVTDWAYDLVESNWPEKIQFYDEDLGYDAAQAGVSTEVTAEVVDTGLADLLGANVLTLDFGGFSAWTVISSVDPSVEVYIQADVEVRDSGGQGAVTLRDVPLLVGFETGSGRVVYSAFPWKAQSPGLADTLLGFAVDGLDTEVSGDQYASAEVDGG